MPISRTYHHRIGRLGVLLALLILIASPQLSAQTPDGTPSRNVTLTVQEQRWLRAHPKITVAQDPGWAPLEFTDAHGAPTGISDDYLILIERRLGIHFVRIRNLSWQESYKRMQRWEIDMTTSVTRSPQRDAFWAFTRPYIKTPLVIIAKQNVTYVPNMRALEGRKVAVVEGYISADWIRRDCPKIHMVPVKSVEQGLKMVQQERVFAFVDNMLVCGYYLTSLQMVDLKIAGTTPYKNEDSMAVRRDWSLFAGILQKALDSITPAERTAIYNRWVPLNYELGADYALLWKTVAVFAVLMAILVAWNRKMSREIERRKGAEQALLQSEERVLLALRAGRQGFYDYDIRNNVLTVSAEYSAMLGVSHEKRVLTLQDWKEMLHPDDKDRVVAVLNAYLAGDLSEYRAEYRMRAGSGEWIWILSLGKIMERCWDGKPLRLLGTHTDITRLKESEELRKKLQSELAQAQKMESVGRLAGGVAHDFNNMLTAILGHVELAAMQITPEDPVQANLAVIEEAALRSADLVRQLLAFARKQTVMPGSLNLNEAVAGMLKMLQRLIGEDIQINWMPGKALWHIKIDSSQVDQLLANLCVNGRDAIIGVGSISLETCNITIDEAYCSTHADAIPGEYVMLAVADDGCGMDKEVQRQIFEPFYTTKEVGKGTGLGLATCYGIVKQNGGFINVYSEPGMGTLFRIYLPRYLEEAADAISPEPVPMPQGHGEMLLLVEDEDVILNATRDMLQQLGYRVVAASTSDDALRLFREHAAEIRLLITDVIMPKMNGRDLAETLLKIAPELKCLFTSGYTADIIAHHGVLDKDVQFLQKPYSLHELSNKVRTAMASK